MLELETLLPSAPDWEIPASVYDTVLGSLIYKLRQTPQEPAWHGEGDVLTHTRMVCEALAAMDAFRTADETTRQILFLAALLHDIGKIPSTRTEDGRWVSPGHTRIGAGMARQILWQDFGLCGTPEKQQLREAVCGLIRYHSLPPHAIDEPDGTLRLRRTAANGTLAPGFTMQKLCILSEADIRGRIFPDQRALLEKVQLCRELAKEAGVLDAPYSFPSAYTAFSYLAGKNISPDYPLYEDTWGEVILMSGLPGTGKDTWIRENCPDIPMISLDGIRKALGISPRGNQEKVAAIAREQAREWLRKKQSFVWNATNITPTTRKKQIELFAGYGARVRLVYLETDWEEQLRRNRERADTVPGNAICDMLEKLTPPERFEAHRVEWICV